MMKSTTNNNEQHDNTQVDDDSAESKNTELISTFLNNLQQNANYTFDQHILTPALQRQGLSLLGTQENNDITYPESQQQAQQQSSTQSPPVSSINHRTNDSKCFAMKNTITLTLLILQTQITHPIN